MKSEFFLKIFYMASLPLFHVFACFALEFISTRFDNFLPGLSSCMDGFVLLILCANHVCLG